MERLVRTHNEAARARGCRRAGRLIAALALFSGLGAAADAQTYSLADGYSATSNTPNDVWSYWITYDAAPMGNFGLVAAAGILGNHAFQGWYDLGTWWSPAVGRSGGQIVGRPGWTNCIGGCQEILEIRFRAPKAGVVYATVQVTDLEPSPPEIPYVCTAASGGQLGAGTILDGGTTGVVHKGPYSVAQGSVLTFTLSPGNGYHWHDLMAIELVVAYDAPADLPDLLTSTDEISLSAGGAADFALNAGVGLAAKPYLMLGSISGTTPGLPTPGGILPLNPDPWFQYMWANPNTPILVDTAGTLDANGQATAGFVVPPVTAPSLVGVQFSFAYAVHNGVGILHASDAVTVTLSP